MAKRLSIPSQHSSLRIVGPRDSFFASRVQRLTLTTDVPNTDVFELGNPYKVGVSKDTPNVTLTFSLFDVGIKVWSVLTGTDPTAYPVGGVGINSLAEADAAIYIKDESSTDYAKSAHGRRLQVRDFAFNYSVDGESTEDYTLIGSERRYLKYDVIVDKFTAGTTSFTLTQTPIGLKNGNKLLSVILDGSYLTETTGTLATGQYKVVGTTLTTFDTRTSQLQAVYHSNGSIAWSNVSDPSLPVAIKGRDVVVQIGANNITRVQSVTINGSVNAQPVKEMGNRAIVGYQKQVPSVTGTITVLDTDTELVDLLENGSTPSGFEEFNLGEGCVVSGINLTIVLQDPCDGTAPYTTIKTVVVSGIQVIGDSFTANVNNNATQTFNWTSSSGQVIVYSGAVIQ